MAELVTKEEIKIGNYFTHNSEWSYRNDENKRTNVFAWEESDWYALGECTISLNNLIPIRITQFQLNKLGFKKQLTIGGRDYWYAGVDEIWSIRRNENGNWEMCIVTGLNTVFCFEPILQYVHQLQNLYQSLTDRQLIYKK